MPKNPAKFMYLRPGHLNKDFVVLSKVESLVDGTPISKYEPTGIKFRGTLADVDDDTAQRAPHNWDQDQHSLTHTIVAPGKAQAKMGDYLTHGSRLFYVLTPNDIGGLGVSTIYYAEERNDLR